jgi:hypothetical protein
MSAINAHTSGISSRATSIGASKTTQCCFDQSIITLSAGDIRENLGAATAL